MGNPIGSKVTQTAAGDNQSWVALVAGTSGRTIRLHGYAIEKQTGIGPKQVRLRWSSGKVIADHTLIEPGFALGTPVNVDLGENYIAGPQGDALEYRQEDAPVGGPGASDIVITTRTTVA